MESLAALAKVELINLSEYEIHPLEPGRLMARFYIAFETMRNFSIITGDEDLSDLIKILCKSKEFSDIMLRRNEKVSLNMLNADKHKKTVRFPVPGKVKDGFMKTVVLMQSILGCLHIADPSLNREALRIVQTGSRLAKCLAEFVWARTAENCHKALKNSCLLSQSLSAGIWNNSEYVSKQFDRIGIAYSTSLVHAGFTSFKKIAESDPRELELVLNKQAPFGNHLRTSALHMPEYDLKVEQVGNQSGSQAVVRISISIDNIEAILDRSTAGNYHMCSLLVGDAKNGILVKAKIRDSLLKHKAYVRTLTVTCHPGQTLKPVLKISWISERYVGLDLSQSFQPVFSRGFSNLRSQFWTKGKNGDIIAMNKNPDDPLDKQEEEYLDDDVLEEMSSDWNPTQAMSTPSRTSLSVKKQSTISSTLAKKKNIFTFKELKSLPKADQFQSPKDRVLPSAEELPSPVKQSPPSGAATSKGCQTPKSFPRTKAIKTPGSSGRQTQISNFFATTKRLTPSPPKPGFKKSIQEEAPPTSSTATVTSGEVRDLVSRGKTASEKLAEQLKAIKSSLARNDSMESVPEKRDAEHNGDLIDDAISPYGSSKRMNVFDFTKKSILPLDLQENIFAKQKQNEVGGQAFGNNTAFVAKTSGIDYSTQPKVTYSLSKPELSLESQNPHPDPPLRGEISENIIPHRHDGQDCGNSSIAAKQLSITPKAQNSEQIRWINFDIASYEKKSRPDVNLKNQNNDIHKITSNDGNFIPDKTPQPGPKVGERPLQMGLEISSQYLNPNTQRRNSDIFPNSKRPRLLDRFMEAEKNPKRQSKKSSTGFQFQVSQPLSSFFKTGFPFGQIRRPGQSGNAFYRKPPPPFPSANTELSSLPSPIPPVTTSNINNNVLSPSNSIASCKADNGNYRQHFYFPNCPDERDEADPEMVSIRRVGGGRAASGGVDVSMINCEGKENLDRNGSEQQQQQQQQHGLLLSSALQEFCRKNLKKSPGSGVEDEASGRRRMFMKEPSRTTGDVEKPFKWTFS